MNFLFKVTIQSWPAPWPHSILPNYGAVKEPLYSSAWCECYVQERHGDPNFWEFVISCPFFRIVFVNKKEVQDAIRQIARAVGVTP